MNRIRETLVATLAFLALLLVPQQLVSAQANFFKACESAPNTEFCKQTQYEKGRNRLLGPEGILTRVTRYVSYVTGAVSVIVVIVGGFRYIVSGGDSNGIKVAKDTIVYALIGLIVSISAYAIASLVLANF